MSFASQQCVIKNRNSKQNRAIKIVMTQISRWQLNNNLKLQNIHTSLSICQLTVHSRSQCSPLLISNLTHPDPLTDCGDLVNSQVNVYFCVSDSMEHCTPDHREHERLEVHDRVFGTGNVDRCVELQSFPYVDFCL